MFSLIITIISIALVAALAVATIYYGGSAFSQGTAKANASALVNAAQQIAGANTLHFNDKSAFAADINGLVTANYLQAAPTAPANTSALAVSATNVVSATVSSKAVCDAVVSSITGGATTSASATVTAARQYDCFGNGPTYSFQFKG